MVTRRALRKVVFQFTHPVRGATIIRVWVARAGIVSIHAPREGCDEGFAEA